MLQLTKLVITAAKLAHSELAASPHAAWSLAGNLARDMEVIKIPQEHVDACLFFRPRGRVETCQDAALSFSQQESLREEEELVEDKGGERQIRAEERTDGWRDQGMEEERKWFAGGNRDMMHG